MTTEQITNEIMNLKEHQAKSTAEHEKFEIILKELQDDVKSTKSLAEDVHIMAINMKNMQKTQDEMNKKVDALTSKEFIEYKENKKIAKQNILSAFIGAIGTFLVGLITWILKEFIMKGGK